MKIAKAGPNVRPKSLSTQMKLSAGAPKLKSRHTGREGSEPHEGLYHTFNTVRQVSAYHQQRSARGTRRVSEGALNQKRS